MPTERWIMLSFSSQEIKYQDFIKTISELTNLQKKECSFVFQSLLDSKQQSISSSRLKEAIDSFRTDLALDSISEYDLFLFSDLFKDDQKITKDQLLSFLKQNFGNLDGLVIQQIVNEFQNEVIQEEEFNQIFSTFVKFKPENRVRVLEGSQIQKLKVLDSYLLQNSISPMILFKQADKNNSNTIDIKELETVLRKFSIKATEYMEIFDLDGNGIISQEEFIQIFEIIRKNNDSEQDVIIKKASTQGQITQSNKKQKFGSAMNIPSQTYSSSNQKRIQVTKKQVNQGKNGFLQFHSIIHSITIQIPNNMSCNNFSIKYKGHKFDEILTYQEFEQEMQNLFSIEKTDSQICFETLLQFLSYKVDFIPLHLLFTYVDLFKSYLIIGKQVHQISNFYSKENNQKTIPIPDLLSQLAKSLDDNNQHTICYLNDQKILTNTKFNKQKFQQVFFQIFRNTEHHEQVFEALDVENSGLIQIYHLISFIEIFRSKYVPPELHQKLEMQQSQTLDVLLLEMSLKVPFQQLSIDFLNVKVDELGLYISRAQLMQKYGEKLNLDSQKIEVLYSQFQNRGKLPVYLILTLLDVSKTQKINKYPFKFNQTKQQISTYFQIEANDLNKKDPSTFLQKRNISLSQKINKLSLQHIFVNKYNEFDLNMAEDIYDILALPDLNYIYAFYIAAVIYTYQKYQGIPFKWYYVASIEKSRMQDQFWILLKGLAAIQSQAEFEQLEEQDFFQYMNQKFNLQGQESSIIFQNLEKKGKVSLILVYTLLDILKDEQAKFPNFALKQNESLSQETKQLFSTLASQLNNQDLVQYYQQRGLQPQSV